MFDKLRIEERNMFQTSYMLKGHCDNCGEDFFSREVNVLVNYISQENLNFTGNLSEWQNVLDPLVCNKSLQCGCGESCENLILESFTLPKICLVEFDIDVREFLNFDENISIKGQKYILKGLARHQRRHFMCAVSNNGVWNYIDDLCDNVLIYDNLNQLYENQKSGWFFCFYVKDYS